MEAGLFTLKSPTEIVCLVGLKIKARRRFLKLSRRALSEKSGVSMQTLARLENKGIATLSMVVKVAIALESIDTFADLFKNPPAKSLDEFYRKKIARPFKHFGRY